MSLSQFTIEIKKKKNLGLIIDGQHIVESAYFESKIQCRCFSLHYKGSKNGRSSFYVKYSKNDKIRRKAKVRGNNKNIQKEN